MAIVTKKIGPISAYAIAKEEGYTGTKEQFAQEIGNAAANAQAAAASATAAEGSATSAATSASNAMSTTPAGYNSMMASIATEYDATATYAVGDYCRYNSEVYRCVTAISAAEAFDSTKWTKVTIGGQLSQLSEDINNLSVGKVIDTWIENAYIKTNANIGGSVSLTPVEYTGSRCAVVDCNTGDAFTITVTGASTPRAWAFIDANNNLLTVSQHSWSNKDFIIIAPEGAKKLILNDLPADGIFSSVSYCGVPAGIAIEAVKNEVPQSINDGVVKLPFRNQNVTNLTTGSMVASNANLATDMINLYGEYSIDFPSDYDISVVTFWDGWDNLPDSSAYYTGWNNTGHIGILAKATDKYVVQVKRHDGADISVSEAENIVIKKVSLDLEELPLKNWKQGTVDATGAIVSSETRIASADILAFPFRGTFTIKLTSGFAVGIRSGSRSDDMPSNIYWLKNGDQYTVPDGHNYFRIALAKYTGTNNPSIEIAPEDAADVECALRWEKTPNVIEGNPEAVKILDAASLIFNSTGTNGKRAVIAHTSDVHGDAVRLGRFADFCDQYGVDYAAVTGDFVAYNVEDGLEFLNDIISEHNTQFGICVGNHDVRGIVTDAEVYNYLMLPNAEKLGNTTGKNYYYKDIAAQKLRMISVSLYEEGIVASGNRRTSNQHMSSEQLAWICSALKSTPSDYGVVIMMHTVQAATPVTEGYTEFYQSPLKYSSAGNAALGGSPVFDIVDAFVSRSTISKTYNQTGTPTPISVTDDFTSVDASVEFIAFMIGHWHEDAITYTSTTVNKLLVLNVTCTNAIYGGEAYPYLAEVSDLHRNGRTQSQDAFNAYAIDRENKLVHVVRIGANKAYDMRKREYMSIPYAE